MRRPDTRWTHAAKVALAATVVVAAVTLLFVVGFNSLIERNLTRDIDHRLHATVVAIASGSPGSVATSGRRGGDVDDVPDFVWRVGPAGQVTALTVEAPLLPNHAWDTFVSRRNARKSSSHSLRIGASFFFPSGVRR